MMSISWSTSVTRVAGTQAGELDEAVEGNGRVISLLKMLVSETSS